MSIRSYILGLVLLLSCVVYSFPGSLHGLGGPGKEGGEILKTHQGIDQAAIPDNPGSGTRTSNIFTGVKLSAEFTPLAELEREEEKVYKDLKTAQKELKMVEKEEEAIDKELTKELKEVKKDRKHKSR